MRKTSLTVATVCATLLWVGAVHAKKTPPPSGQAFPATGQTTSYAAGDDGAIKAGAPLSYTHNGDGTITDNNTKLMWEKKSNGDGSLHEMTYSYPWSAECQDKATLCQSATDCSQLPGTAVCTATDGQGTGLTIFQWVAQLNAAGFAGHTDWRVPNVKELQSIVDYGAYNPAVDAAFNTNCIAPCTVTTCSCTESNNAGPTGYWSATTYANQPYGPFNAWVVVFLDGFVSYPTKGGILFFIRAVRGGL